MKFPHHPSWLVIDCDVEPNIPGAYVERHDKGGAFEWSSSNVGLYQSEAKHSYLGRYIIGSDLDCELKEKKILVLNACVLNWLLDHQAQVPEEWKGKKVWFWGTIYHVYPLVKVAGIYWDSTYRCWRRELRSLSAAFTYDSFVVTDARSSL